MRRVRPGPERDAFIQRMRDRWTADEAALRAAPFPILGLAPPFPTPVGLGTFATVNGQVTDVQLRYGEPGPAPGPVVTVSTAVVAGNPGWITISDALRDLMGEVAAIEHPPPPKRADAEAAEILIESVPRSARIVDNGLAWAAIAELYVDDVALVVTVAARGLPLSGLALTRVDDLGPILASRRERFETALARSSSLPSPEDWDLPPARGLAGHQALATAMIAMTRESKAAGGVLRDAPLGSGYAQRWEVATRAQMDLARQGRDEAEDAIHSMVNHLCQLAQSANWFTEADLADYAVAETLDHVAHRRHVPSAEAQEAWSRYWGLHGQDPPAFAELSSARAAWQAAWQRWVERR
ncbi:MAG TPA: hypothetical protein VLM11_01205 [Streptosporangiaceae bacterium]|nr:hypothetical protein [Streptosporangiaceae bacterium]